MSTTLLLAAAVVVVLYLVVCKMKRRNRRWNIMRFHRPSCGACKASQSEWDIFKNRHNVQGIFVSDINMEQASPDVINLARKFNINGVPTVVAVDQAGNYRIFEGMRTYDAYRRWAELL